MAESPVELFELQDSFEEGERGFDEHPLILLSTLADFRIGGVESFGFESLILQDDHLLLEVLNHAVREVVVVIGGAVVPAHHLAPLVEQHEEF